VAKSSSIIEHLHKIYSAIAVNYAKVRCLNYKYSTEYHVQTCQEFAEGTPAKHTSRFKCIAYTYSLISESCGHVFPLLVKVLQQYSPFRLTTPVNTQAVLNLSPAAPSIKYCSSWFKALM